jgi:asparagine synthase (glutamine-hydrolysing)
MCGICGIAQHNRDNRMLIKDMCDILRHRGPEKSSFFQSDHISLGHRRLSIIDLNTGDQPIFNEDKTIVTVFNGEIYNFKILKKDLQVKGHRFKTDSDTEVLVHGYEEYGTDFFQSLNGIFAFAIYDTKMKKLLLVRDQFGIKPLHYWFEKKTLVFASEIKAILLHPDVERRINYNALHSQINLRYNQNEETLFKGIHKIPPAHYLVYENNSIVIKRYYELSINPKPNISYNEAAEGILHYLKLAVERQLLSDVPIAVYLSGGIDSSAIVALMSELTTNKINTFTMGFNEETDEFSDAQEVAQKFNTNHQTSTLSLEPLQRFADVIRFAEEPKINLLQGFNMSSVVGSQYKVALGGLGGDELFAGYDIYKFFYHTHGLLKYLSPHFQKIFMEPISKVLFYLQSPTHTFRFDEPRRGMQMLLSSGNLIKFYLILRNCWDYDKKFSKVIYHPDFKSAEVKPIREYFDPFMEKLNGLSPLDQIAYIEFHSKMVNDYLLVEDRMSMAHSLELRVPFLDLDLVEYMFTIPTEMKIKKGITKHLLREVLRDKLPERIIEKKKWGFTVNPYEQFKKDLEKTARKILTKEFLQRQGIFNHKYINRILDYPAHPSLRWHYNYLWLVLGFAIWEKMFILSDDFKKTSFSLDEYSQ